jgi:hypothetical protein
LRLEAKAEAERLEHEAEEAEKHRLLKLAEEEEEHRRQ